MTELHQKVLRVLFKRGSLESVVRSAMSLLSDAERRGERLITTDVSLTIQWDSLLVVQDDPIVGHLLLQDYTLIQQLVSQVVTNFLGTYFSFPAWMGRTLIVITRLPAHRVCTPREAMFCLTSSSQHILFYQSRKERYHQPMQLAHFEGRIDSIAFTTAIRSHSSVTAEACSKIVLSLQSTRQAFGRSAEATVNVLLRIPSLIERIAGKEKSLAVGGLAGCGSRCLQEKSSRWKHSRDDRLMVGDEVFVIGRLNVSSEEDNDSVCIEGLCIARKVVPSWPLLSIPPIEIRTQTLKNGWEEFMRVADRLAPWCHASILTRCTLLLSAASTLVEPIHTMFLYSTRDTERVLDGLLDYLVSHTTRIAKLAAGVQAPLAPSVTKTIRKQPSSTTTISTTTLHGNKLAACHGGFLVIASVTDSLATEKSTTLSTLLAMMSDSSQVFVKVPSGAPSDAERNAFAVPCKSTSVLACQRLSHNISDPAVAKEACDGLPDQRWLPDQCCGKLPHAFLEMVDTVIPVQLQAREGTGDTAKEVNDADLSHIVEALNKGDPDYVQALHAPPFPVLNTLLHSKVNDSPQLSDAATMILQEFYLAMRKHHPHSVFVSVTLLTSLVKVGTAIAILLGSDQVSAIHALGAVALISVSLSYKTGVSLIATDVFASTEPEAIISFYEEFLSLIGQPKDPHHL
ncbi:hypothetical protein DIPPA_55924 [Diplonema papillatum]|nr:hypothetical protein DIPPA_55924 [Diplonema papillatum]